MPSLLLSLVFVAAMQAAPAPLVANSADAQSGRLHVGQTGIHCYTRPCPERGVFAPDAQGHAEASELLYADLHGDGPPPPLLADDASRIAIESAWEEHRCLAIYGRLIPGEGDRPMLRVDQVIGPCGGQ